MVKEQSNEFDAQRRVFRNFKDAWKEKKQAVAKAKAGKGGKRSKQPQDPLRQLRILSMVPDGAITQAEAKQMLPPFASIWNNWKDGAWCAHQQGHGRTSGTWLEYGHRGAALHVIRDCWQKYLDDEARPLTDCPVAGLSRVCSDVV